MSLKFNNRFAQLGDRFYTPVTPDPPSSPVACHINPAGAALIGLDTAADEAELLAQMGGYELMAGMEPVATVYAGHQFGHFVPQLGDGRALILGEAVGLNGSYELNLKGGGQTPYSRRGDGRAVIRSTVREYLMGEAFHGLGVPTTRSLAFVTSNEPVRREHYERAATMIRLAPSFIRFGHFEYFHTIKDFEAVKTLADFVIDEHFQTGGQGRQRYVMFYYEVVRRTAELMADWLAQGWVHGVMNTDNMSILGLTIDYGPFGFLDGYIADRVWNHTDEAGRYAFNQQPNAAFWSLKALGHALSSLLSFEDVDYVLGTYQPIYQSAFAARMGRRLGLAKLEAEDAALINGVLARLSETGVDYHHALRDLYYHLSNEPRPTGWQGDFAGLMGEGFMARFEGRLSRFDPRTMVDMVRTTNPLYVLRNHHLDSVIEGVENNDFSQVDAWLEVLSNPFDRHAKWDTLHHAPATPELGACLSCSS
jgi:uncharacterized protein YdiU (UPF0061 family)